MRSPRVPELTIAVEQSLLPKYSYDLAIERIFGGRSPMEVYGSDGPNSGDSREDSRLLVAFVQASRKVSRLRLDL